MTRFNADMLVLAREVRALSQDELADKAGLSQSKVSKIEASLLTPSDDDLKRLSECLNFPQEFFIYSGRRAALGSSCIYNRKRQSLPAKDLKRLHAQMDYLRIQVEQLLTGVELSSKDSIYRIDIDSFDGDAARIAKTVRQTWGIPVGPCDNLVGAIENAGGIVVKTAFGTDKLDALSQWAKGLPPIFFVNSEAPADRMRFSLAHELGHVVMHAIPTGDLESEADRFAAEFLMPEADILPEISGKIDLQKLASLKPRWRVSMQALARRCFDLQTITERQYRQLFIVMGKMGWRRREPVAIGQETPRVVTAVADVYLKQKGFSFGDLCRLAFCREDGEMSAFQVAIRPLNPMRLAK
jgi:Zn-dependent peptidase ImmA (M78 family)